MVNSSEEEVKGRDELNLAEFPISILSDRPPPGVYSVTFKDRIKDRSNDEWITRKVTISATEDFGLPTPSDSDVIIALILHTRQINNFTSRRVPFTRYELLNLMGWSDDGGSYKRIANSLRRWTHVTLTFDTSWRDKARKKWTSKIFHVLDEVEFNIQTGRRKNELDENVSWYTWNETLFDSIREGNIKKLDLTTYFSLNTAIAKRMFRYLDKHFYKSDTLKFDLDTFAYEKIGMSRKYNVANIKRKLEPAILELEACGFIEPCRQEDRYIRIDRGEWKVVFLRNHKPIHEPIVEEASIPFGSVERRLVDYGVTEQVAKELAAKHTQEEIDKQIKVLLWKQTKEPESVPNPGGFLYKAITENWAVPQGYYDSQKKAEKKQELVSEEERKSRARQAERIMHEKTLAHWNSLDEDAKKVFMEEAMAATSEENRSHIKDLPTTAPLYRGHMAALRDEHLRRVLGFPPVS